MSCMSICLYLSLCQEAYRKPLNQSIIFIDICSIDPTVYILVLPKDGLDPDSSPDFG